MVVKWITENHGGFVTVDTEVGKGTTFGLFLPKPEAVA
jgi:signal transduction histidine kinase